MSIFKKMFGKLTSAEAPTANKDFQLKIPTKEEIEAEIGPGPQATNFEPISQMTEEQRSQIKPAQKVGGEAIKKSEKSE